MSTLHNPVITKIQLYPGKLPRILDPETIVETPLENYVSQSTVPQERITVELPKSRESILTRLKVFVGEPPKDQDYKHHISRVLKVQELSDEHEKKNAILQNARWVVQRTQEVVDIGYENFDNDKDPWTNLDTNKGVPLPYELYSLTGDKRKQHYYFNSFLNHLAKAIVLSIEQDAEIRFYFDVDGTIEDKSRRPYLTRFAQACEQILSLDKLINVAVDDLGIRIFTNTNRSPERNIISNRGFGLDTPRIDNIHFSPYDAIAGLSPKNQLNMAKKVGIVAGSTGYRNFPGEYTFVAPETIMGIDLYKHLGDTFVEKYIRNPDKKHKFIVIEPKSLNKFLLDTIRVEGRASDNWAKQILAFVEEYRDKETGDLKLFQQKLLEHLDEGDREIPGLEMEKNILEARITDIENEIKELKKLNQDESTKLSIKSAKAELKAFKKELHDIKTQIISYVRIIGKGIDSNFLTYRDSFGYEQRCINYYKCFLENPHFFVDVSAKPELAWVCKHIKDSRNIPHPEAIDEDISIWDEMENLQLDNLPDKPTVRELMRKGHYLRAERSANNVHPNSYIKQYVEDGQKVYEESGLKAYLRWRLCKFLELHSQEAKLENHPIFNRSNGKERHKTKIEFKEDFQMNLEEASKGKDIYYYLNCLKDELKKSNGPERILVPYIDTCFLAGYKEEEPAGYIKELVTDENPRCFYPDAVYCNNYMEQYTGYPTLLPINAFEDKRTANKPWGQGYDEVLSNLEKSSAHATVSECLEHKIIQFSFGDSLSDLPGHNRDLHCIVDFDGTKIGGGALQIYNHLGKQDYIIRAIKKRVRNVIGAKEGNYKTFNDDYTKAGIYGLEEIKDNGKLTSYRKVIEVEHEESVYLDNKVYTEDEIKKEIWDFVKTRIYHTDSPAEQILFLAKAMEWITGADCTFNEDTLEKAKKLHETELKGKSLTQEERKLVDKHWVAIDELERMKYFPQAPSFGVYYEYFDLQTQNKYYRMENKKLATKEGEYFNGDEERLSKTPIDLTATDDEFGVFIYRTTKKKFDDPAFLSKCLTEEEVLPPTEQVKGLFQNNFVLKTLGLGNSEKGKERLKAGLTKLPKVFSSTLAWCGGLLTLGGLIRLGSNVLGPLKEPVYSAGYWLSQIVRAGSALAGACRGLLNVNKYYAITIGEFINIISALFIKNGPKHMGFALGNIFLLTGRGMQSAQRALSANVLTKEEINAGKPVKGILDPRPFQLEITKFSTEKIMLPIKRAMEKAGLSPSFGHFIGSSASAILTTLYMVKQIIQNPKLITQVKTRISDKSGNQCKTIPSVAHLFGLSGVLSGLGAVCAGILGRTEKLGELAENGFNKLGRWAISFATFIQSIPIIFNGLEIAANQNGLSRITRGLDGKTIRYNPERAGYGQVFAGVMFAITSWFDLSKSWAASIFDAFAMGPYFGMPKTKLSVAGEEEINSLELAENILFESDQFFIKNKEQFTPAQNEESVALEPAA